MGTLLAFAEVGAATLSWALVTGGKIACQPALGLRGTVYLPCQDRNLYAVSPSGWIEWSFPLEGRPSAGAVVAYDGTIYAGTEGGTLYALAPNGAQRWRFSVSSGACLSPCLGKDGSLYLPTTGGTLYALDYMGGEKWRYRFKAPLSASPAVGPDGTLYISSEDRRLHALEPGGGKKWEASLPGPGGSPAVGWDGTLYVGGAGVQALSPAGTVLWSYAIPARTADPVLCADGTVVAGALDARLYALSPRGEKLWELELGEGIRHPAAITQNGAILVAAQGSRLYAVSPSGRVLWSFSAREAVSPPTIGEGGRVYFGAEDWILYCLETEHGGPAPGPWSLYLHDTQHCGRAGALQDLEGPSASILREMAFSFSAELKASALEEIESHLEGRRYLAVHLGVMEEVLAFLAREGVSRRVSEHGRPVADFPLLRLRSCRLLGALASNGARGQLLEVVRRDPDQAVAAAALKALGSIGLDPQGEVGTGIGLQLERGGRSEAFVLAGLEALAAIQRRSGPFADAAVYSALVRISQGRYPRRVRLQAQEVLGQAAQKEAIKRRSP